MNTTLTSLKQTTAVVSFALAAFAGTMPVQAVTFSAGDAVLVLYDGTTEYYRNLGSASTLTSGGADFNISASFMSQLTGPIEYTIIGGNAANFGSLPTSTFEGSAIPSTNTSVITGWTASRNGAINQQNYWNAIVGWNGQVGSIAGSEHTLAASDARAFSAFFGTDDKLAGAFPLRMSSNIETTLYLLGRNFLSPGDQTAQSGLGQAMLSLLGTGEGRFTFGTTAAAPVPVPAAVILFGSGLIGLVGMARRAQARRVLPAGRATLLSNRDLARPAH
jgi:hypothetical protein